MELKELTSQVSSGTDLSREQAMAAADCLASSEVAADEKEAFLTALSAKGEVAAEVAGLAERFRSLARDPGLSHWQDRAVDVCGTGGDQMGSFNISTTVVFALAAAGIPVFKHGNRSITSKCGSANLLEALGVDLMADDATLQRSVQELGFCFMFAPAFHPAFKEVMPVRQRLAAKGQRSVFNILGPLINPGYPSCQLLGVYAASVVGLMARSLEQLGLKSGMVVHCRLADGRGFDELSVVGDNLIRGFGALEALNETWTAEQFGLERAPTDALQGGELEDNLRILDALLLGKAPRGLEDTVVINIAAAFHALGRRKEMKESIDEARELLLGGAVRSKLDDTKDFYASR